MRTRSGLGAILVLTWVGCGGGAGGGAPSSPSTPGSSSHNAGRNCLDCHGFSVAGTIYRADGTTPYPGAVVRLTREAAGAGEIVLSLTTDASGNFYTNAAFGFGSGLYADASGSSRRFMQAAVTSGACNSCHGSGNRIRVD